MNSWGWAAALSAAGAIVCWLFAAHRLDRHEITEGFHDTLLERAIVLFLVFALFAVIFTGAWAVTR